MDWHQVRLLKYMPDHFIKMDLKQEIEIVTLLNWLVANTNGRVAIVTNSEVHERHAFVIEKRRSIGFENPAEATLFSLFF